MKKMEQKKIKICESKKKTDTETPKNLDQPNVVPAYQNEVSLYAKETSEKIHEFRMARSRWIELTKTPEIKNVVGKEDEHSSDVYRGRCAILRKIGFKTNRLQSHYKSLRPLRCYTLNRKVSDSDVKGIGKKKKNDEINEREAIDDEMSPIDLLEEEGITVESAEKSKSSKKKEKKIDIIKSYLGIKKKTSSEREYEELKKMGPSKRVLEKLKAAQYANKGLASCKCENGKEVTFIIKGLCLCEKTHLDKFKTNESCGEYCTSRINKVGNTATPDISLSQKPSHLQVDSEIQKTFDKQKEKPMQGVSENEKISANEETVALQGLVTEGLPELLLKKETSNLDVSKKQEFLSKNSLTLLEPSRVNQIKAPHELHVTDSLEVYRQRLQKKPTAKGDVEEHQVGEILNKKSGKSVSFLEGKKSEVMNYIKPKKSVSLVILYKNNAKCYNSEMSLTKDQLIKLKKFQNKNETENDGHLEDTEESDSK